MVMWLGHLTNGIADCSSNYRPPLHLIHHETSCYIVGKMVLPPTNDHSHNCLRHYFEENFLTWIYWFLNFEHQIQPNHANLFRNFTNVWVVVPSPTDCTTHWKHPSCNDELYFYQKCKRPWYNMTTSLWFWTSHCTSLRSCEISYKCRIVDESRKYSTDTITNTKFVEQNERM